MNSTDTLLKHLIKRLDDMEVKLTTLNQSLEDLRQLRALDYAQQRANGDIGPSLAVGDKPYNGYEV